MSLPIETVGQSAPITEASPEFTLITLLYSTGVRWTLKVDSYDEMWIELGDDRSTKSVSNDLVTLLETIPGLNDSVGDDIITASYPHPLGDDDDPDFFDTVDEDHYYDISRREERRLYRNLLLADRLYLARHRPVINEDEIVMRSYSSHGRSCPIMLD